jgi:hypothetical protein
MRFDFNNFPGSSARHAAKTREKQSICAKNPFSPLFQHTAARALGQAQLNPSPVQPAYDGPEVESKRVVPVDTGIFIVRQ